MGQKAKWKLPLVVSPSSLKCASINIPNDPDHIAAFQGAVYQLSRAYSWQDDEDHTAKDVAAVWLNLWEQMTITEECGTPDTPWCGLWDFHDESHSDAWEGLDYFNDAPTWDSANHGWASTYRVPPAGINQFLVMKFHSVDPIHVTHARIGWVSAPIENVGFTVCLLIKGDDPTGAEGYVQSSGQAADWNGFLDTAEVDWTDTDFVIRTQQANSDSGAVVKGNMLLIGVNLYGDGSAPAGATVC